MKLAKIYLIEYLIVAQYVYSLQYRRACGHVDEGMCPHQVLVATLTLSQPGGGQIMPILYWGPWLAKINRGGPEYYVLYYSNYSLLSKISTCKIQLNKTFFVACLLDLSNKIYF